MSEPGDDGQTEVSLLVDFQQAQQVIADWTKEDWANYTDLARRFAAALAAEREKARAPFLPLIESVADGVTKGIEFAWDGSAMVPLAEICRVAEEG